MASNQTLPPKEQAVFKKAMKHYELKQNKQALKCCRQILSQPQFSKHGETLAMKGLILNTFGKKEEAYDYVKKGLMNNLKSHVCWHVYGLLHRAYKDYAEASKCYRNALKYDPENQQILRDLSVLQMHLRDLEGFKATRNTLLQIRPQQQASWIAYAVANHLLEEYEMADKILESYENTQGQSDSEAERWETSELVLYRAQVLREGGLAKEALAVLESKHSKIVDRPARDQMWAELCFQLGRVEDSKNMFRKLLERNPENEAYFLGLEKALGINSSTPQEERIKLWQEMETKFRSYLGRVYPITHFAEGELLETLLRKYLKNAIKKGVAPMFKAIKPLYSDPKKTALIEKITLGYLDCLTKHNKFEESDSEEELPTSLMWLRYFLAQHYDILEQHLAALDMINAAIEHTPTMVDLYMVKAKIYKHGGDAVRAAYWQNYARELDTADRFINTKCVKYMFNADQIEEAEKTAFLFTREADMMPIVQLIEMQCLWFEVAEAESYFRLGDAAKALKKLDFVDKHFTSYIDDQFDFHLYAIRKMSLRTYVSLLRFEDSVRAHRFFLRAALLAVRIYLSLFDKPYVSMKEKAEEDAMKGLTPAERKKLLSKQRKAAAKAAAEAEKTKNEDQGGAVKEKKKTNEREREFLEDKDPNGEELAKTKTPLEDALKFIRPLQKYMPQCVDVHTSAFEIYKRKGKVLLMLQSIKRAAKVNNKDPLYIGQLAYFVDFVSKNKLQDAVKTAVDQELAKLTKETNSDTLYNNLTKEYKDSPEHILYLAETRVQTKPDAAKDVIKTVLALPLEKMNFKLAQKISQSLETTLNASADQQKEFHKKCLAKYPLATRFGAVSPTVNEASDKDTKPDAPENADK